MKYLGCAFLLIALVSCGSVPVKSTFVEAPDPSGDTCSDWPEEMSGMHAAILGTDKAFRMSVCPDVEETSVREVSAWKGETVSAMVLIWSASDLENVRVDVSKLRGRGGVIPSSAVETFFVRYTLRTCARICSSLPRLLISLAGRSVPCGSGSMSRLRRQRGATRHRSRSCLPMQAPE